MKSESKRIISNVIWLIFDKVFTLALSLVVTVSVANYYSQAEYGNYQYAISVVAILEIVVKYLDVKVVKKRYLNVQPEQLVFNATICRIIFSVIAAVLGTIIALVNTRGKDFTTMLLLLLLNAIIVNMRFGMDNRFEYDLKSKNIVIASDISIFISYMLQLLCVKFGGSIIEISLIIVISSVINLILIIIQYHKAYKSFVKGSIDFALLKDMLRESLPFALAASCSVIYSKCDSIMLGSMLTANDVAIYSIALKVIAVLEIANEPIRSSLYPKFIRLYNTNFNEYEKRYLQCTSILSWLSILCIFGSFVVLPYAFKLLRPEYSQSFVVYQVYTISAFFIYNASLRAGHITLVNEGKILLISQSLCVILNIILNYLFISNMGLIGAAIATGITQGFSLVFSNLFFGKQGRQIFMWQVKALNPKYIFIH